MSNSRSHGFDMHSLRASLLRSKSKSEKSIEKPCGYHLAKIIKGSLGELSKIQEELDEAKDAEAQGAQILVACELADLIGAIRAYAKDKLNLELNDLVKMSELTERAFKLGERK